MCIRDSYMTLTTFCLKYVLPPIEFNNTTRLNALLASLSAVMSREARATSRSRDTRTTTSAEVYGVSVVFTDANGRAGVLFLNARRDSDESTSSSRQLPEQDRTC